MMRSGLAVTLLVAAAQLCFAWPHGWGELRDQMWVDFAGRDHQYFPTASEWQFVADNYAIVSLSACFAQRDYPYNEDSVVAGATILKRLNPSIKVLNYFNTFIDFSSCYRSGNVFDAHPSWWLRDDSGVPYVAHHDAATKFHDLTQQAVRDYVATATTNLTNRSALFDGAFGDKAGDVRMPRMSDARNAQLIADHHLQLNATRLRIERDFAPGAQYFSNSFALHGDDPPQHGAEVLPFVDGVIFEHFMSFEMLDARGNGSLVPRLYQEALDLIDFATRRGKAVLVRGWPGPVAVPITRLGPSYLASSGLATPITAADRAAALQQWVTPSLAGYLIAASSTTYWTYNWWYTITDGVTPCAVGKCSGPAEWYPAMQHPIGNPLGPYTRDPGTWVYRRRFEWADVVFDASNMERSNVTFRSPYVR